MWNKRWFIRNLHIGTLLLFHLFPSYSSKSFTVNSIKSSVASAPAKNIPSFSFNSDNNLISKACLAICQPNSNSKCNLVLKEHTKSHILPVSIKFAIPMSLSNFCDSSTLSNSSDAMVLKPSFDSYLIKSSSSTNSASQRSFCPSKFSGPKIPTTLISNKSQCFLFRFLQSLNLITQNLLARLLEHLIFCLFW